MLKTVSESDQKTEQQKRQIINKGCRMLQSFFEDTEQNGSGLIRPFVSIENNNFIKKILISNKMAYDKGKDATFLELSTYTSMTIFDLKNIIG
jgi:hypothetical protein